MRREKPVSFGWPESGVEGEGGFLLLKPGWCFAGMFPEDRGKIVAVPKAACRCDLRDVELSLLQHFDCFFDSELIEITDRSLIEQFPEKPASRTG